MVQLDLAVFVGRWQGICKQMLKLRYEILESPSKAQKRACAKHRGLLEPNQQLLLNLECQLEVNWRNTNGHWNYWCYDSNPRFPPRYYAVELSCQLKFLVTCYELRKIRWVFKR